MDGNPRVTELEKGVLQCEDRGDTIGSDRTITGVATDDLDQYVTNKAQANAVCD